jgi:Zn-dependent protease with chaperone function
MRLRDVVEEMAVASEMAVPEIYVLDCERGTIPLPRGHTREDVAIGVTFGAIKLLTRDELQGMIAHQFSHVLNGDTRLNLKLMGLAHGLF